MAKSWTDLWIELSSVTVFLFIYFFIFFKKYPPVFLYTGPNEKRASKTANKSSMFAKLKINSFSCKCYYAWIVNHWKKIISFLYSVGEQLVAQPVSGKFLASNITRKIKATRNFARIVCSWIIWTNHTAKTKTQIKILYKLEHGYFVLRN